MNERIKKLMLEVGYVEWQDWVQLEKFAELIIRECAEVAANHDALDIYENIRDHFGVSDEQT